jgi:predicted metal-dependent phosphotriesterase family hydrolase
MSAPKPAGSPLTRREAMHVLGATAGLGVAAGLADSAGVLAAPQQSFASANKITFPRGAIIRLVLKDERPENLGGGAFLWHEHPMISRFVSPPGATMTDEEQLNLMVEELKAAKAEGIGCMFDATHHRRSPKEWQYAKDLATRSGLPFGLAGSRDVTFDKPWWSGAMEKGEQRVVDELAEDMYKESIEHRWAALGEIGTQLPTSELDRWYMKAVAKVQLRTNLRIYTHTPPEGCPSCAMEQLDLYEKQGVDPKHLCIGHLGDITPHQDPGWPTHKTVARRGAYIGFDSVGAPLEVGSVKDETTGNQKVKMVLQLLEAGYEDQILFSTDTYKEKNLKANYGVGFAALIAMWVPKLRYAGVNEALIRKMAIDNPRRFFAFVPKGT